MRGFTLLECLIVLTIGALMSMMAIGYWDGLLANKAVQQDAILLTDTFRTSQLQALASHQTIRIMMDEDHLRLSGKTRLIIRAFPAHKKGQFTFTPYGMTDFQNASIYVCSKTSPIARHLRVNQAGRVVMAQDNAYDQCEETS